MAHASPKVEEALRILRYHLKYVVQVKDPEAQGPEREWCTRNDIGQITGKAKAYDVMNALKERNPVRLQWRVLPQNEADRYQQGVEVGKKLALEEMM
jgi:hypothetical protein